MPDSQQYPITEGGGVFMNTLIVSPQFGKYIPPSDSDIIETFFKSRSLL